MDGPVLTFEHFQIETDSSGAPVVLGTSEQGRTFRAFDTRLRKTVALKVVDPELISDENIRKRFLNEARAAAGLSHPNIARVIHLCPPDAAEFYYAMELVEGESLAQRIKAKGRLPVALALTLLRPITDVLVALGHQRLVHRDIQPANLILTPDPKGVETVKLINFGLAKSLGSQHGLLEIVETAELRATQIFHLSPEQIRGETVESRTDFYSLGITLWTALAGKPPFVGSAFDISEGHLSGEMNWAELPPTTSPVRALLETLLAKSPHDRPADATALTELWEAALHSLESVHSKTGPKEETETAARTVIDPPAPPTAAKAPHLIALSAPPPGCSRPPESGFLAENTSDGEIVFVRPIPNADARSIRPELLATANLSLTRPNPALLNVCEIDDQQIVSEWRRGVTVADLLASRPTALPRRITGAWLRTAAQAVDWAREHSVGRANFSFGSWLVEFLDLKETESPLERAARPPETWGQTTLSLDPLAGFDPIILLATSDPEQTLPAGRFAALTSPTSYLTAFARFAERLLEPDRSEPLGAPARSLLTDAAAGQSKFATAREWVSALLGDEVVGVKTLSPPEAVASAAAAPVDRSAETANAPVVVPQVCVNLPNASPAAQAAAVAPPAPVNRRLRPAWSALPRRGLLIAAVVAAVAGLGIWGILALRAKSQRLSAEAAADPSAEVRRLIDLARGNLEQAQYAAASNQLTQARNAAGNSPSEKTLVAEIEALEIRLEAAQRPVVQAPAAPAPTLAAEPPRETGNAITSATREAPFENRLGMTFVPVPIEGGETGGRRVLFAVTETRVREFEKFARRPWREVGASEDFPAVAIIPADVANFCRWLDQQSPLLAGWRYRLPTDHEWSCAAGIGRDENPTEPAAAKGTRVRSRFAWGMAWPPPLGSGNFADVSLRQTTGTEGIKGYDDQFAGLAPVKRFKASPLGLYDLTGNAAEWCYDATGFFLRGGAFNSASRHELDLAARSSPGSASLRDGTAGFRLVISDRSPPGPTASTAKPSDLVQSRPSSTGTSAAGSLKFVPDPPAYSAGNTGGMTSGPSAGGPPPQMQPQLAR